VRKLHLHLFRALHPTPIAAQDIQVKIGSPITANLTDVMAYVFKTEGTKMAFFVLDLQPMELSPFSIKIQTSFRGELIQDLQGHMQVDTTEMPLSQDHP
jgi:hypothetical protein